MKIKRFIIIGIVFIIGGCSTSNCAPHASSDTEVPQILSTSEISFNDIIQMIIKRTETTVSATDHEPSVVGEPNDEITMPQDTIIFDGLVDLREAEYYSGGCADFNNLTLARKSTGEFFISDNLTSFNAQFEAIKNNYIQCEVEAIRTDTELIPDILTVNAAGCELAENYNYVNNEYLYCSGEVTLSGILRYRKQNDPLGTEVGRKGDILFYPYPDDLSNLPLIFSFGYFSPTVIIDEDNEFYMLSDTIELLLGNTETETVNTRINEIYNVDIPFADIHYNNEVSSYLFDSEYYAATLVFSDLFLLSYQDRMTGEPYSTGNVTSVLSVDAYDKEIK